MSLELLTTVIFQQILKNMKQMNLDKLELGLILQMNKFLATQI